MAIEQRDKPMGKQPLGVGDRRHRLEAALVHQGEEVAEPNRRLPKVDMAPVEEKREQAPEGQDANHAAFLDHQDRLEGPGRMENVDG